VSFMIVAGALLLGLFLLAYFRPGRHGLTILALVAGSMLASFWSDTLASYSAFIGTQFRVIFWRELISVMLVLVPALLLLLFSKKGASRVPRLFGAFVVGALAVTLLLPTLTSMVIIEPGSRSIYTAIDQYRTLIITIALVVAFIDVLFTSSSKPHGHDKD